MKTKLDFEKDLQVLEKYSGVYMFQEKYSEFLKKYLTGEPPQGMTTDECQEISYRLSVKHEKDKDRNARGIRVFTDILSCVPLDRTLFRTLIDDFSIKYLMSVKESCQHFINTFSFENVQKQAVDYAMDIYLERIKEGFPEKEAIASIQYIFERLSELDEFNTSMLNTEFFMRINELKSDKTSMMQLGNEMSRRKRAEEYLRENIYKFGAISEIYSKIDLSLEGQEFIDSVERAMELDTIETEPHIEQDFKLLGIEGVSVTGRKESLRHMIDNYSENSGKVSKLKSWIIQLSWTLLSISQWKGNW